MSPYDTSNAWYDCNQVRWQGGEMQPIGGWERLTGTPLDSAVRRIEVWRNNINSRLVLIGTDAKLYTDTGGYTDVTPSAFAPLSGIGTDGGYGTFDYGEEGYGNARSMPSPIYSPYAYWSLGHWGEDALLTANSDGRVFFYDQSTPTVAPTVISAAPTGVNAVLVTNERAAMIFGMNGDGRTIAWSSREDYTDWDFASTTNTAGFLELTSKTPLLKGVIVNEGVLAFSYTDVFLIQNVGLPYVYGGQNPISATSMFNPNGIATFNGKAVWLSRMGFQLYSGGFVQPLPCPLLGNIFEDMDPVYGPFRMHASHNGVFNEVWFWYPSVGQTECDRYVIWNYVENWFAMGSLSRSAMAPADAFRFPYCGASDGNMYQHEDGTLDAGESRVGSVWAETSMLGVGDSSTTIDVQQMQIATGQGSTEFTGPPFFAGNDPHRYGALTVTAYGRMAPEGAETTFGPYRPRSDGYTDTRISSRDIRLRFDLLRDGGFSVGKMRLDIVPGSRR